MILRLCFFLFVALAVCSCENLDKQKKKKKAPRPTIEDASNDVNFQAFLGRLRKAVAAHDVQMLASMMTPDFGYRLEPPGEGEGVFQYWDEKGIWKELELVLNDRFVPSENYMVAPPQFAMQGTDYHGYRAGIAMVNGSWKFAYFVTD